MPPIKSAIHGFWNIGIVTPRIVFRMNDANRKGPVPKQSSRHSSAMALSHMGNQALPADRLVNSMKRKSLQRAVSEGTVFDVDRAIARGADVHTARELNLVVAVNRGSLPIVEALLRAGADVTAREHMPALNAAGSGRAELLALLLRNYSPASFQDLRSTVSARGESAMIPVLERTWQRVVADSFEATGPSSPTQDVTQRSSLGTASFREDFSDLGL